MRRITFWSQPGKIVARPYLKNTQHKNRGGRVAEVVEHLPSQAQGPEFKLQYCKRNFFKFNKIEGSIPWSY
jgi:hypothetical protein